MKETEQAAEEGIMRFRWPKDTVFHREILDVEQDSCSRCGQPLHVCAHRRHRIFTLKGPVELLCRLAHCSDPDCPARGQTLSPAAELTFALPRWLIGWDVFCWMGQRRFARHWSVSQLQAELRDAYRIPLRPDAILGYLSRYQAMLAARQQDPQQMATAYAKVESLVLSIDGLQPEKGHETLYTVRELAKPTLEADSTAKVQMRRRVRGLRDIERAVLKRRQESMSQAEAKQGVSEASAREADAASPAAFRRQAAKAKACETARQAQEVGPTKATPAKRPGDSGKAGEVVLGYCAMVRGSVNDDQGG